MRRIDLLCKLIGPLVIALLDGISTQHAILINFGMNAASVVIEYYAIAQVYNRVPALHEPKQAALFQHQDIDEGSQQQASIWQHTRAMLRKSLTDFRFYIHHRTFLPSFAGALLYLTVLSFAGQMVTYLLSAGYSSTQIGAARTLSVGFEVLATWVAPSLIGAIGPIRAGLWLSAWQLTMLVGGTAVFLGNPGDPLISATGLVGGTILSRLGLRGFDLCVQLLTQEVSFFISMDFYARTNSQRTSRLKAEELSHQRKRAGKICLKCSRTCQQSCSSVQTNSSGRHLSRWVRWVWQVRLTPRLYTSVVATCCIWKL